MLTMKKVCKLYCQGPKRQKMFHKKLSIHLFSKSCARNRHIIHNSEKHNYPQKHELAANRQDYDVMKK